MQYFEVYFALLDVEIILICTKLHNLMETL